MTYNSSFEDRANQAAKAKEAALERYRSRPPVDEKLVAGRTAARLQREATQQKNAARKQAEAEASAAVAAVAAAAAVPPSDAERKAARDARYAARKRRK